MHRAHLRTAFLGLGLVVALGAVALAQEGDAPPDFPYRLRAILGGAALFEDGSGKTIECRVGQSIGTYAVRSIELRTVVLSGGGRTFRVSTSPGAARPAEGRPVEPPPDYPWQVPAWRATVRQRLAETRIDVDARDEPLERVLARIQEAVDVRIRIEPRTYLDRSADELRIDLSIGGAPAARVLATVLAGPDLVYGLDGGGVVVGPAGTIPRELEAERVERGLAIARARLAGRLQGSGVPGLPDRGEAIEAALASERIPAGLTGRPLPEVVDRLFAPTGGLVAAMPGQSDVWQELEKLRLPGSAAHQPIGPTIRAFLAEHGLMFERVGTNLLIGKEGGGGGAPEGPAPEAELLGRVWQAPAEPTTARQLAAALAESLGIDVYPGPAVWRRRDPVSVRGGQVELGETLDQLAAEYDIHGLVVGGALYLLERRTR